MNGQYRHVGISHVMRKCLITFWVAHNMYLKRLNLKLAMILFIAAFMHTLILLYAYNTDDFVPKHVGATLFLINGFNMPTYVYNIFHQNPAYYGFIAIILHLTDICEYEVPSFPIVMIPYFFTFFALIYVISGKSWFSFLLALLLAIFDMTSSLCGSYKIFLWPHGLGSILVYSYILLLYNTIKRGDQRYTATGLIIIFALIFMSYNKAHYLLSILGALLLISFFKQYGFLFRHIKISFLFFIVVLFGLSKFVYNTFIPLFAEESSFGPSSPINTFMNRFFTEDKYVVTELDQLLVKMPEIFTYLYSVKYALYVLLILLGFIAILGYKAKKYNGSEYASEYLRPSILIYASTVTATVLYMIARLAVGYFPLPEIYNIVLFSVIVIACVSNSRQHKNNEITRIFVIGVLVILIIINLISISIANEYKILQKDNYNHMVASSNWLHEHYNGSAYFPDQLTYAWYFITYSNYFDDSKIARYMPIDDIICLYLSKPINKNILVVLNYRSNYNAISRGRLTKPFSSFREIVETNPSIEAKIYTYNNDISIILT